MPVTSTIVPCPAGQWTPICEYMDRRKSLMVQCPEVNRIVNSTRVDSTDIVPLSISLPANSLRASLLWTLTVNTPPMRYVVVSPVADGAASGSPFGVDLVRTAYLYVDDEKLVRLAWSSGFSAAGAFSFTECVFEEFYQCRAVILGINTSGPTYAGPYGTVPLGIWTSPDLDSGPAMFRLSDDFDDELTIQQWFAWPVGTGTINVQVFQSFSLPEPRSALTVQIPSLSPHGKQAAMDLIAAMTQRVPDGLWLPDDEDL